MKKMIWLTTASILFIVFIFPGLLALRLNMIPLGDQPGYDSNKRLSIYGKRDVSQKFLSEISNFAAIGTSIRNPNLNNKKDVILDLYDSSGKLVRKSVLNGQNLQDGDFIKFVFDSIADSKNQTYTFTLSSPSAGAEDTIEVFYIANDAPNSSQTKDIVEYTYDQKTYPGGIPIVVYSRSTSRFETMKKMYSNLFSRFVHLGSQSI